MFSFYKNEIKRKRVETPVNHGLKIIDYGFSNLYPQLMNELYKCSPLTKSAIQVLAEFYAGQGWKQNGDTICNREGQTFNEILRIITEDISVFNGFALHMNYNGVGQITEVQNIPFEYVRLGLPNQRGQINKVYVSQNWEQDTYKEVNYTGLKYKTYSAFNPRTAIEETLTGGTGQVLYFTPKLWTYPLATFDAIRDAVQTDAEIQTFMLANIQNGFLSATLFKYPGGFDSEEDKDRVEHKLKGLKGAYNANSFLVAETPEDFNGDLIETIPANNNDKLFEQTGNRIRDIILQNYAIPGPLMGVSPEGGIFTQQAIRDSYIYMNTRTKNKRKLIERIFYPISQLFGINLGEIEEQAFEIPGLNMPKLNGDPNQLEEETPPEEETPQAKLRKIYGS